MIHEVRIHLNNDEGTRWWAEGDDGFAGGADRLGDLCDSIVEWAQAKGFVETLRVRLIEWDETADCDDQNAAKHPWRVHSAGRGVRVLRVPPRRSKHS